MLPRWAWQLEDADGVALDRPLSPVFTTQFDAEEWLGEHWRELARQSVVTVRLLHDGAQATAPIALRPPE